MAKKNIPELAGAAGSAFGGEAATSCVAGSSTLSGEVFGLGFEFPKPKSSSSSSMSFFGVVTLDGGLEGPTENALLSISEINPSSPGCIDDPSTFMKVAAVGVVLDSLSSWDEPHQEL